MEPASEKQIGHRRIQTKIAAVTSHLQSKIYKCAGPFLARPVVVFERNAVAFIPDPVHKAKNGFGKFSILSVIFDNNEFARYTLRFTKENQWIFCMVKHIDEHYCIENLILKWK